MIRKLTIVFLFSSLLVFSGHSAGESEKNLKVLSSALDTIINRSASPVDEKSIIFEGIHGMLRTLDPYTQFLDEDIFAYMQDQQKGSFFGIGISFDTRDGQLIVVAPIEGSPAAKLGIRAGDIIVKIDGETTAKITNAEVIKRLRGDRGSKVIISINRRGNPDILDYEITREKIALNSVRGGFLVTPSIGYVRITEFTSTTGEELLAMVNELVKQNAERLILDLRFNSGGLLSAAEDVASLFLRKGDMIVSTHGRQSGSDMALHCKNNGQFLDLPLVILVNSGSASSSEIVAGAIQDHNRGLILGTNTHGKGLVGTQYPMDQSTALQITTAQYFTPSGKFIQKPYDIPHRVTAQTEHILHFDETRAITEKNPDRNNHSVRTGGIYPDIEIPEEELSINLIMIESASAFFDFVVENGNTLKLNDPSNLVINDSIVDAFVSFCTAHDLNLKESDITSDRDAILNGILRESLSVYSSPEDGEKARILKQNQVKEAIKAFDDLDRILDRPLQVSGNSLQATQVPN